MQTSKEELTIADLIYRASMRPKSRRDDSLSKQLTDSIKAISPTLDAEFQQEGTQHPLAHKTLTEIRAIAAAGNLPTGGSEARIANRDAAGGEWNRRNHADEIPADIRALARDRTVNFDCAAWLRSTGWVSPYGESVVSD